MTAGSTLNVPTQAALEAARSAGVVLRASWRGISYERFADDFHGIPRGTVCIAGRIVPGYPHIGRLLALGAGVRAHFGGPFVAEEKIDGYNVRIVCCEGEVLPLTRGGFVCPFTADRLADLADVGPFFAAHPDAVLCAEVAGPGNPYISARPPRARERLRLFVFDVMDPTRGSLLSPDERDEALAHSGLPRVPHLGRFGPNHVEPLVDVVRRLDAEGSEGVVLKAVDGSARFKYATPRINLEDIVGDAFLIPALEPGFFSGRMMRLAMSLAEFEPTPRQLETLARELGEGLLTGLLDTVRAVRRGQPVVQVFEVEVHSHEAADAVVAHVQRWSRTVRVREVGREERGEFVVVRLEKTFVAATDRLRGGLSRRTGRARDAPRGNRLESWAQAGGLQNAHAEAVGPLDDAAVGRGESRTELPRKEDQVDVLA